MKEDKIFHFCIIGSIVIHLVLLIQISYTKSPFIHKPVEQLEVVYHSPKSQSASSPSKYKKIQSIKGKKKPKDAKALFKKHDFPTHLVKDAAKFFTKIKSSQKKSAPLTMRKTKRSISVPMLKSEKITNPKYLSYHQKIREKIKEKAYIYVNEPGFEAGEVYLTFALMSDGTLKQIKIIEEKTAANQFLRNVGLRSIRDSSPFPVFPKNLNYPELSFNVVISFEINE